MFRPGASIDNFVMSYVIVPIFLIGLHGLINLGWLGEESNELSIFALVTLVIVSYEIGFKTYYLAGRRLYFHLVFLVPFIMSFLSATVWLFSQ